MARMYVLYTPEGVLKRGEIIMGALKCRKINCQINK